MAKTKKIADFKTDTPPKPRDLKYDWEALAEQAQSQPGEWLLVFEKDHSSYVTAIRGQKIKALRGFEVRTAENTYPTDGTKRTCKLWVRAPMKKGK